MPEDIFFRLLSRQLAGEANEKELRQLKEMIDADPELKKLYLSLTAPEEEEPEEELSKAEQAFALHSLKMHLHVPDPLVASSLNRRKYLWLAATGVISICALLILLLFPFGAGNPSKSQVVTKKGSKTMVKLPDGSSVWVNSDSRLQYTDNFKGRLREVWLDGEAFFDVKKDPDHPFVIHTNKINIKVLGTAFNVKSYPEDQTIETALIRGRIEVSFNDRPSENIILHPNEKLTVSKEQSVSIHGDPEQESIPKIKLDRLEPRNGQSPVETAWMDNKIAFFNSPMSAIAIMLERRFDISIEFKNQDVMKYRYTGVFDDESVEDILKIMKTSKPFNYKLNGKKLTITN